ncbi:MAG TPA: DNA-binding protein [Bacteroidales bacterium]|nr:DNA-binding protein [Bacteroidales bacterium]
MTNNLISMLIEQKNQLDRLEKLLQTNKEIIGMDELVEYTGLAKSYIYKLTASRDIPHYRPNGKILYFKKSQIDEWMLRNRIKTNAEIEENLSDYLKPKKKAS